MTEHAQTAPMQRDICCANWKGLLTYLENHYGADGIRLATAGLLEGGYLVEDKYDPERTVPLRMEHLTDPAYWVSNECSLALFENVARLMGGDSPLRLAGAGAVRESLSRTVLFAGRVLGPHLMARRAARVNARFNRTKDVKLVQVAGDGAVFHLFYRPGFRVTKHVCDWNLGIYTEIARIGGCRRVHGRETECVLSGGARCTFELTWAPGGVFRRLFGGVGRRLGGWALKDLLHEYDQAAEDRNRLIDQLSRSEARYRAMFEDSLEAMSVTRHGRLVDANPAWMRLHGVSDKEHFIGRDVADFVHPEDRGVLTARRCADSARNERVFHVRDLRADGGSVPVEVYSSRIRHEGEALVLATVRDITDRIRTEAAQREMTGRLQRAEKMEALAALAGGVAHDLNNILAGIVGYPDLLLTQVPEDSPLRQPILTIQKTGLKAAAVVQDLLTLARREVAVLEALDLNRVVNDFLSSPEWERMRSYHTDVSLDVSLAGDILPIRGSAVHLSKAVMNLVSNAMEAISKDGVVTVTTGNRYIETPRSGFMTIAPGEYAVVEVADTGVGIRPEDREKIFEPFFTKKVLGRSGTGLGMTVVWSTVKDHGGFIDMDGGPGQGTRLALYFPVTRDAPAAPALSESGVRRGSGQRVLVVDDVAVQRQVAVEMLTHLGYTPEAVSSGEEALAWLSSSHCDLVLLDMIMSPGMDGLEAFRAMRRLRPDLRVLLASGFSTTERVSAAIELGAAAYLKKPYTLSKLAEAVHEALL